MITEEFAVVNGIIAKNFHFFHIIFGSVSPAAIAGERLSYILRPCGWGSGRLSDLHSRAQL